MASNAPSLTPDHNQFSYNFYSSKLAELIYEGDAHFPADTTYLRLTKTDTAGTPLQSSFGRVIYPNPVLLWCPGEQVNFETTVKFVVKPKSADGLVFFMAPVDHSFPSNTDGGNLGIFGAPGGRPAIFVVEFDVFVNPECDRSFPHVGIDVESRASKSVVQIPPSFIGKEVTMSVSYVAATNVINTVVTAGPQTVSYCFVKKR